LDVSKNPEVPFLPGLKEPLPPLAVDEAKPVNELVGAL